MQPIHVLHLTRKARRYMKGIMLALGLPFSEQEALAHIRAGNEISAQVFASLRRSRRVYPNDTARYLALPCGTGVAIVSPQGVVITVTRIALIVQYIIQDPAYLAQQRFRLLALMQARTAELVAEQDRKNRRRASSKAARRRRRQREWEEAERKRQEDSERRQAIWRERDQARRAAQREQRQPPSIDACLDAGIHQRQNQNGTVDYLGRAEVSWNGRTWYAWGFPHQHDDDGNPKDGVIVVTDVTGDERLPSLTELVRFNHEPQGARSVVCVDNKDGTMCAFFTIRGRRRIQRVVRHGVRNWPQPQHPEIADRFSRFHLARSS